VEQRKEKERKRKREREKERGEHCSFLLLSLHPFL
jgi:hypothetical protein